MGISILTRLTLPSLMRFFWAATLIALPVTSFRYIPFLGSGTLVRPLAMIPLAVLLALYVWDACRRRSIRHLWNDSYLILGIFLAMAALSSVLGALHAPVPVHGQDYIGRVLRGWVTIGVGIAFFLGAIWSVRSENDLKFSLKWLFAGMLAHFAWGTVQGLVYFGDHLPWDVVDRIQTSFSIKGLLAVRRLSGLAFEPSWLAGQLVTLYFPWLFAYVLSGYKIFRNRFSELILLAIALLLLLGTYSRSGIAILGLVTAVTVALVGKQQIVAIWQWVIRPFKEIKKKNFSKTAFAWGIRAALLLVLVAMLAGSAAFLAQNDYFAQLWRSEKNDLVSYVVDIYAGPRLAYAYAGYQTYEHAPWLGVGIGASGLYMYQNMPNWSMTFLPEIARMMDPRDMSYPNPKNIYARLLAETGIIGFWMYMIFQFYIAAAVIRMLASRDTLGRFAGMAGLFTWFALLMIGFSQDSFAMPNLWIIPGIVLGLRSASHQKMDTHQ